MSEQPARGSALAEGEHNGSGKKPRASPQAVAPGAVAMQEREEEGDVNRASSEGEASQGSSEGGGASLAVVLEAMDEPQIALSIGVSLLLPLNLKPPTFKCEAGHVVCCTCRGKHGEACGSAATYAVCDGRNAFLLDAKLPCQHEEFGCNSLVVYCKAAEHHVACPWAPCSCPVPGCGILNSAPRLVEHFRTDHRWPVTSIRYGADGASYKLPVPAQAEVCHVPVGEGGRSVLHVSSCARALIHRVKI